MPRDESQDLQVGFTVVNQYVCVGEQYCRLALHLTRPLARVLSHRLTADTQYLRCASKRDSAPVERLSHESRQTVLNEVVSGETRGLPRATPVPRKLARLKGCGLVGLAKRLPEVAAVLALRSVFPK